VNRKVVLRPRARADLRDIWLYTVERWSKRQAESYVRGLYAMFGFLADQPEVARERLDVSPPVRLHPYKSHLVIFRASDLTLDVLRVVHGRSNWWEILGA
jgi:toxin ParE1/3/4